MKCCAKSNDCTNEGIVTCRSCGQTKGCEYVLGHYFDFYEYMYEFRNKSVYARKYTVDAVLIELSDKGFVLLDGAAKAKVRCILSLVDNVSDYEENRKRLVKIPFLVKKILELLDVENTISDIAIAANRRRSEAYWNRFMEIKAISLGR